MNFNNSTIRVSTLGGNSVNMQYSTFVHLIYRSDEVGEKQKAQKHRLAHCPWLVRKAEGLQQSWRVNALEQNKLKHDGNLRNGQVLQSVIQFPVPAAKARFYESRSMFEMHQGPRERKHRGKKCACRSWPTQARELR